MQPIEEKAKKLLGKKKLTSLALGQLLIKDLVASYNGTFHYTDGRQKEFQFFID